MKISLVLIPLLRILGTLTPIFKMYLIFLLTDYLRLVILVIVRRTNR